MHFDPLSHLPDVDEQSKLKAVPLGGRPLWQLLFSDWRKGAIGESEYFQAWILVWLALGPIILALLVLYLTSLLDITSALSLCAMALLGAVLIVVTANLSAKRARGKGLPGWIGPASSLWGWLLMPLSKGTAALLIAAGPMLSAALIDRFHKKLPPSDLQ